MLIDAIKNLPFTVITQLADGLWKFDWASTGAASYRVAQSGRLASVEPTNTYSTESYSPDPPAIEVAAFTNLCLSEAHQSRLYLQWYRVASADTYKVQKADGSAWVTEAILPASAEPVNTYITPDLESGVTHTYRVIAVNETGGESDPLEFIRFVVTPPEPPDVDVSYASGDITVALVP